MSDEHEKPMHWLVKLYKLRSLNRLHKMHLQNQKKALTDCAVALECGLEETANQRARDYLDEEEAARKIENLIKLFN